MKKYILILTAFLMVFLLFTSCADVQKNVVTATTMIEKKTPMEDNLAISSADYTNIMGVYNFSTINEMYQMLENMTDSEIALINDSEKLYMENTSQKTFVSQDEKEDGIFKSARQKLISRDKILFPYIDGIIASLNSDYEEKVTLTVAGLFRKPWISYSTSLGITVDTMMYDVSIINEANEKGASWLTSELEPDAMNIYNYEEQKTEFIKQGYNSFENLNVYEKEYSISDRAVKAMVIDYGPDDYPTRTVYFVYDSTFARIYGSPDKVEEILPRLSLHEIDPITMTTLDETIE